jgi:hypothetical protein
LLNDKKRSVGLDLRVEEECVLCSFLRETAGKEERE